jgi:NAD(P)-dependent dehydrogenase (short-subunit alcohol dehydrogenase family)
MKAVVVGASSGLGRSIATHLVSTGAEVALLARRKDRLDAVAAATGYHAFAVECDVTDDASIRTAIDESATRLGGIDSLVYATGIGPLARIEDFDATTWRRTFDTNVVGAALITAAALPHLRESNGAAAYLSSVQSSMTPPWPGMATYAVTKAALDKMVEAWRVEHPEIGFTRIVIGECMGGDGDGQSQFAEGWDVDLAMELMPIWTARGHLSGGFIDMADLAGLVETVLRGGAGVTIPSVTITPRPPA